MLTDKKIDAVVISSYTFDDKAMITTGGLVHNFKLYLNDNLCSYSFLESYFRNQRNLNLAEKEWRQIPKIAQTPTFLNGPYLADLLQQKLDFHCETINNFCHEKDRLEGFLSKQPSYAVISSSLIMFPQHITEIIDFIKERVPECQVIVGGTKLYKSYKIKQLKESGNLLDFTDEWLEHMHYFFGPRKDKADYYIVNSRGESTLLKLITAIQKGEDPRSLPNLAYYENDDRCVINGIEDEPYLLGHITIDWSKVDPDIIGCEVPISVKQGCQYRCNFCDFVGLERKLVTRTDDLIMRELRAIETSLPGKPVCFVDENMFQSKNHLRRFCSMLIKEKLNIRWRGFTRVDVIDEEMACILRDAGCYFMALGVESGDQTVLNNMNKKITPELALNTIYALNRAGIGTYSTLFIGFPGETDESVQNTINFLNSYPTGEDGLNFYSVNSFYVLPMSPVSTPEMRSRFGVRGYFDTWRHDTMNSEEARENVLRLFQDVQNCYFVYLDSAEYTVLRGNIPEHKTIIQTRQDLVRKRVTGISKEEEQGYWDKMEQAFVRLGDR